MIDQIKKIMFSSTGIAYAIGTCGFLSSLTTLFLDVSSSISLKWLLLTAWISLTFITLILKLLYDAWSAEKQPPPCEVPIKYLDEEQTLIIRRNEYFAANTIVGCYRVNDGVELFLCMAIVSLIQEKIIQIKPVFDESNDQCNKVEEFVRTNFTLMLVKPVVPVEVLSRWQQ